ncbi:hypothetical protein P175DRAFT_0223670 [Aspergillus ochraceoroseus IBT 24754]|uniref:Uncharacterized protein n=1 Tax=Aspergillus ochraceoroseus IBT 24754 TaxID=1392256 RepID=A0A2T5LWE2_9EURO|nr:uncharacterized protein P175DRAFT_0223670 [Aspergillus ochraceoroseus IBT 24754]PTU20596.1 hypothetical protein P175DRAFT_0223670 [Aspergillus ochraceoroseus IBT 24754]
MILQYSPSLSFSFLPPCSTGLLCVVVGREGKGEAVGKVREDLHLHCKIAEKKGMLVFMLHGVTGIREKWIVMVNVLVAIFRCCWLTIARRYARRSRCQFEDFSLSKGGLVPGDTLSPNLVLFSSSPDRSYCFGALLHSFPSRTSDIISIRFYVQALY